MTCPRVSLMMNLIKVGLSTCYNADFEAHVEQWSCVALMDLYTLSQFYFIYF